MSVVQSPALETMSEKPDFGSFGSGIAAKECQSRKGWREMLMPWPKLVVVWEKWRRIAWSESFSGRTGTLRRVSQGVRIEPVRMRAK